MFFQCPNLHKSAVSKEMSEKGIVDLVIVGFKGQLSIHDNDDGENATEPIIKSANGAITINNENGRICTFLLGFDAVPFSDFTSNNDK